MPSMIDLGFAGAALLAALAVPVAQAQSAHHDHAAHTAATQTPTQRWTTDAPLRAGMRDLREATELLNHYQMGHLDDVQRDNAVAAIDAAIKNMIANCKLKPDADTLADSPDGVAQMAGWIVRKLSDYSSTGFVNGKQQVQMVFEC